MLLDRPPKVDTSSTFEQLAIVNFNGGKQSGISGSLSGGLTRLMRHHAHITKQMERSILDAMFVADAHLSPIYKAGKFSIRVQTGPDCFSLTCPGDACGIHTYNLFSASDLGVEFGDHNVDSPMQAFTLLAGLATFLEKAEAHVSRRSSQTLATV